MNAGHPLGPDSDGGADPDNGLFVLLNGHWEALQRGETLDLGAWATLQAEERDKLPHLRLVSRLYDALQVVRADSAADLPPAQASTAPPGEPARQFLEPGTQIDQCRIESLLGYGGMGEVYLAEHTVLRNKVAVTVLPAQRIGDAAAERRFLQEMRVQARMNPHPNVATAFHAGEYQGRSYLVMEYVPGIDLEKHVRRRGPLPWEQACAWIRQAAVGLDYVHGHHIVHRDLKPSNLRLTLDGTVKILDLGLARYRPAELPTADAPLTPTQAVLGTLDYMAPEQAQSAGQADGRSDLYSLGCTFYYLLTGAAPFADRIALDKLVAHARDAAVPVRQRRPELPVAVAAVVAKLLAKKPEDRYPSARALLEALDAACAGTRAGGGEAAPAGNRRRQRRRLLVAGLVLMGVLAVVIVPWQSNTGPKTIPSGTGMPVQPVEVPPWKGAIDLRLSEPNNPRRQLLRLHEPAARPLRVGDEIRVEAELNRPGYLYVLWIDTTGKVSPVYPWLEGNWQQWRDAEQPRQQLSLPDRVGDIYKMEPGPAGMETLVLLVRDRPWPRDQDLAALLGNLGPQPLVDPQAIAWFENGLLVQDEPHRAPNLKGQTSSNVLLRTQQRLQEKLHEHFGYLRAVCFANQGGP